MKHDIEEIKNSLLKENNEFASEIQEKINKLWESCRDLLDCSWPRFLRKIKDNAFASFIQSCTDSIRKYFKSKETLKNNFKQSWISSLLSIHINSMNRILNLPEQKLPISWRICSLISSKSDCNISDFQLEFLINHSKFLYLSFPNSERIFISFM